MDSIVAIPYFALLLCNAIVRSMSYIFVHVCLDSDAEEDLPGKPDYDEETKKLIEGILKSIKYPDVFSQPTQIHTVLDPQQQGIQRDSACVM